MSKTTKAQLAQENLKLVEENKALRQALLEASMVERRSYEFMLARRTRKQSRNTICNIAVALKKDGRVNSTGVIATAEYDAETEKVVIRPIGVRGYNFWGFADAESLEKLGKHILYLADYDQIPEVYKVKFHGKNMGKVVNQLTVKGVKLPGGKLKKAWKDPLEGFKEEAHQKGTVKGCFNASHIEEALSS